MEIVAINEKYLPERWTPQSACLDLRAHWTHKVEPWEMKLIPLWIKSDFRINQYARSSLPLKFGLMIANGTGIIDMDYRWELGIIVHNPVGGKVWNDKEKRYDSFGTITIKDGERIAQIETFEKPDIIISEDRKIVASVWQSIKISSNEERYNNWSEIHPTERWEGGFGSTGK